MVETFKGQHAVVLCLGFAAEQYHASLVDSSIKAGVKHLVASTYGGNDRSREAAELFPIAAQKAKIIGELKARETPGWAWTAICCGLFFDLYVLILALPKTVRSNTIPAPFQSASSASIQLLIRLRFGTLVTRNSPLPTSQQSANRSPRSWPSRKKLLTEAFISPHSKPL